MYIYIYIFGYTARVAIGPVRLSRGLGGLWRVSYCRWVAQRVQSRGCGNWWLWELGRNMAGGSSCSPVRLILLPGFSCWILGGGGFHGGKCSKVPVTQQLYHFAGPWNQLKVHHQV